MAQIGNDPIGLTDVTIFLPNNRAIRSMREAFVRIAAPGLLMPRLVAVGDLAIDEALGPIIDPLGSAGAVPPAIDTTERLMLMTRLLRIAREKQGRKLEATEAIRLARLLLSVIDELAVEQVGADALERLHHRGLTFEDVDLSSHWQVAYHDILGILPAYRQYLSIAGLTDPAERRNILLAQVAARIPILSQAGSVIAVGIATSAPAVAQLLKAIAFANGGQVILPAIDITMEGDAWDRLGPTVSQDSVPARIGEETHPQFHLKLLLERMGIARDEIAMLGLKSDKRHKAIQQIFCSAPDTVHWAGLAKADKQMPTICLLTSADSAEEARAIAIHIRGILELPEQRVALITPDREIALRVAAILRRWDIQVDDTAGVPLEKSLPGGLMLDAARAMAQQFAPVTLLALLKHPLICPDGIDRVAWLRMVRRLDLLLRGPISGKGLAAIDTILQQHIAQSRNSDAETKVQLLLDWWHDVRGHLAVLEHADQLDVAGWLEHLSSVLTKLTAGNLWRRTAGRELASTIEALNSSDLSAAGKVELLAIPDFLAELLKGRAVREPYGGHPRVQILGLLEARLQSADYVICAGLNEGSWPQLPQPDPWLAPRIRRDLGIAGLDRNIGLSAHDLATLMGAKQVLLTRARRDRSGPTVASRFLLRLEAFLGGALQQEEDLLVWARHMDRGADIPAAKPPAIRPNRKQRDVSLSVTDFDRLLSDPYAIYAKRILKVEPLRNVGAKPDSAWQGSLVHSLLEEWTKVGHSDPDRLMHMVHNKLADSAMHPTLRLLWQPRILKGLEWVAKETQARQAKGEVVKLAEERGVTKLSGVTFSGKADRIDADAQGNLVIIDYKTGEPPAPKQIKAGFALQLGLLGHLVEQSSFKGVSGKAIRFEYWSLAKDSDTQSFGYVKRADSKDVPAENFVAISKKYAVSAIENYILSDAAFEAKKHPEFTNYADYDQMSRLQEWAGRGRLDAIEEEQA